MSRTLPPPEASAMASAPATVVFPVPPLPVTTCSRTPSQSVSRALTQTRLSPPVHQTAQLTSTRAAGVPGHWRAGRFSLGWIVEAGRTGVEGVLTDARSPRGHPRGADRVRIGGGGPFAAGGAAVRAGHRVPVREDHLPPAGGRPDDHQAHR